jgi:hypothetical protein
VPTVPRHKALDNVVNWYDKIITLGLWVGGLGDHKEENVNVEQPVNHGFTRREFLSAGAMAGAGLIILSSCGGQNNPAVQGQGGGAGYEGPNVELQF